MIYASSAQASAPAKTSIEAMFFTPFLFHFLLYVNKETEHYCSCYDTETNQESYCKHILSPFYRLLFDAALCCGHYYM
jgi:hypothetical protein